MFASKSRRPISIGDESVTIRKLSALQLEEAQLERQKALGAITRNLGDLWKVLREGQTEKLEPASEEDRRRIRNAGFDRLTVLVHGIDSWSVSEQVSKNQVEDLDEPTSRLLFESILDYTFEDVEARKKD